MTATPARSRLGSFGTAACLVLALSLAACDSVRSPEVADLPPALAATVDLTGFDSELGGDHSVDLIAGQHTKVGRDGSD